jgi:hypothetical protein
MGYGRLRPRRNLSGLEKGIVMAGKYTPLENYLRDLPVTQKEVTLTFKQIEKILNDNLPSSAYEDRRWWDHETEGNHVNKRAWANAGWEISSLDVKKKRVTLIRRL